MACTTQKNAWELLAQLKEVIQQQEETILHQSERIKQLEEENALLRSASENLSFDEDPEQDVEESFQPESSNYSNDTLSTVVRRSSSFHRKHLEEQDAKARPESYELSSDLLEKRIEVLRNKYGGAENAEQAARVIQEAYRGYRMRLNFRKIRKSKSRRLTVENKMHSTENKLENNSSVEVVELVAKASDEESNEEIFDKLHVENVVKEHSGEGNHDPDDEEQETFDSLYDNQVTPNKDNTNQNIESTTEDPKTVDDMTIPEMVVSREVIRRQKRRHHRGYETITLKSATDSKNNDEQDGVKGHDDSDKVTFTPKQEYETNGKRPISVRVESFDESPTLGHTSISDSNPADRESREWARSSSNASLVSNAEENEAEEDSLRSSDTASIASGQSEFSNSIMSESYQRRSTLSTRGSWHIDSKNDVMRKRSYRIGLNLFNKKPEKGIEFLVEHAFIERTAPAVASFLLNRKGLSRQMVGEFLGNTQKRFNLDALDAVCELMDFSGMDIDEALRDFQRQVKVQGEAQKVDRLVEAFSQRYCTCNPKFAGSLKNPDAIFVLAFAIIMLNTDLHSPNMKHEKRMTEADFIKNLRGVDGGNDLDANMLHDVYTRIKNDELKTGDDHVTQVLNVEKNIIGKKPVLAVPHRRLVCYCRLYQVNDPAKPQKVGIHQRAVFLFNDLLLVTKVVQKRKNSNTYGYKLSLPLQGMNVLLFETTYYLFGIRLINTMDNKVLITFNAPNEHDRNKFVTDLRESINEVQQMENYRIGAELERAQLPLEGRNSLTRDAKYLSASMHNLNEMKGSHGVAAVMLGDERPYQVYASTQNLSNRNNNNFKALYKADDTAIPNTSPKEYGAVPNRKSHHERPQNNISIGYSHV